MIVLIQTNVQIEILDPLLCENGHEADPLQIQESPNKPKILKVPHVCFNNSL